MGTPTVITFQGAGNYGPDKAHHLYRHNDGDPVTQLREFATILRKAHDKAHDYFAFRESIKSSRRASKL